MAMGLLSKSGGNGYILLSTKEFSYFWLQYQRKVVIGLGLQGKVCTCAQI